VTHGYRVSPAFTLPEDIQLKKSLAMLALTGVTVSVHAAVIANVISSTPVVQTVSVPQQNCRAEQVLVARPMGGAGATIGAVAGGILGSTVGHGSGKAAATAAGVVTGAVVGNSLERSGNATVQTVQACQAVTVVQQQIIGYETGVADVVDPMAGSYLVESLTDEIEKRAFEYIERIEGLGGVVKCIESGWIQNEIQNASYQFMKDMEAKKEIVVGVNEFVQDESYSADILKVSEEVSKEQIARLKAFKAKRDPKKVEAQLAKIREATKGTDNLMPVIIEAVESHITLGEIAGELREVFGLFKESITL